MNSSRIPSKLPSTKQKATAKDGKSGKKTGKPKRDQDARFAWKKVLHEADKAQEKKVDGKTY